MDIFEKTAAFLKESGIDELIKKSPGVTVAFSGGADSSLLLHFLVLIYGKEKISACHVNHMIRGEEADRDEEFCRRTAESYGIEFFSQRIDVPALAKEEGLGIEEAARKCRYKILRSFAGERLIATAHNATDNMETVIFNLARGTGIKGIGGIAPIRDNVIRPLLSLTGDEVRCECERRGIAFVCDSTNLSADYTRNFIRQSIVPALRELNGSADAAFLRTSRIARETSEYIEARGQKLIESGNFIYRDKFIKSERTACISALQTMFRRHTGTADGLGEVHLRDAYELALSGTGEISMPHKVRFICSGGRLYFGETEEKEYCADEFCIHELGKIYPFGETFAVCAVKGYKTPDYDKNIYNLFIKDTVSFDTIKGSIFVRSRREGDRILSGGMHKKLKKLMCDKNVPVNIRDSLPIFCDGEGIFLVPGLCRRDKTNGNDLTIYIYRQKGPYDNA